MVPAEPVYVPAAKERIDVMILPRFFCSGCYHELTLIPDIMLVFCNSPRCHQYKTEVSIKQELRRITI